MPTRFGTPPRRGATERAYRPRLAPPMMAALAEVTCSAGALATGLSAPPVGGHGPTAQLRPPAGDTSITWRFTRSTSATPRRSTSSLPSTVRAAASSPVAAREIA